MMLRELETTRYRLRRTGRREWLDRDANLLDAPEAAALFPTPGAARQFAVDMLDEPNLWSDEPVAVPLGSST